MNQRPRFGVGLDFTLATVLLVAGCHASSSPATTTPTIVCDPALASTTVARGSFNRTIIDDSASGAAFVTVADLDGNGRPDLIVSRFGDYVVDGAVVHLSPARLDVYYQGAQQSCWQRAPLVSTNDGLYFVNQTTAADVDGDGDLDIVLAAGFFVCNLDPAVKQCGAIAWLENVGGRFVRHDLVGPGDGRFYTHVEVVDFDGDGIRDLVTVGETSSSATTIWLRGEASARRFDPTPRVLGDGLGSFPIVADLDGDGDLDVAAGEYFVSGESFAWLERRNDASFVRHAIATDRGRGFQLALIPNLDGDGVTRAVGTNHVNAADDPKQSSGVFVFDRPADATAPWPARIVSDGIMSRPSVGAAVLGAPGVFGWGDVDGDGDTDLVVAGDGDARIFWLEQTTPAAFVTHVIDQPLGQASGARVVDLDADGKNEIVFTGYEDGVVAVYRRSETP